MRSATAAREVLQLSTQVAKLKLRETSALKQLRGVEQDLGVKLEQVEAKLARDNLPS